MDEEIVNITKKMDLRPGVSKEALLKVQNLINFSFPIDYMDFLLKSNGVEGMIGSSYLSLWRVEDLEHLNTAYAVNEFAPGLLLIGSNGGDTAYAFDTRKNPIRFVEVPFIGMNLEEVRVIANSFLGFLKFLSCKH